jgi:hypothetical protein
MSFDRPILVYSNYCSHSQNYLQALMKHPEIYDLFIRMNIDVNPQTKQRPSVFYKIQQELNKKIVRVPTIIIKSDSTNEILLLSDKDAFKWLEFQINSNKTDTGIKGFNINEMGSFSDGYSKFGQESTHINDANEQNFKFYKNINGKRTLPGENFKIDGAPQSFESFLDKNGQVSEKIDQSVYNNLENERHNFENTQNNRPNLGRMQQLETMSNQQSTVNAEEFNTKLNAFKHNQNQQKKPSNNIDFTNPNFGLSQELNGSQQYDRMSKGPSQKSQELDSRLNQLMMDRQN